MKRILSILFLLFCYTGFAQYSYTLSTYTAPYIPLSNPSPVVFENNEDEVDYWDNPQFSVPFGFEFEFGNNHFESAYQVGGGANFMFLNFLEGTLSFCGLYDDLMDVSAISDQDSSIISYQTTGTVGNQVTTIQYENAGFADDIYELDPPGLNRINFQIRFFENGGIVEVHYGAMNIPNPENVFDSGDGPTFLIAVNLNPAEESIDYAAIITGEPSNPTLVEIGMEQDDSPGLSGLPEPGRVYRLTPGAPIGLSNIENSTLKLFPTLVDHEINIEQNNLGNSKYRIFDMSGKQVKTGNLTGKSINVSHLSSGSYLLIIDGNAAKFVKK